jgi:hypothetical protein
MTDPTPEPPRPLKVWVCTDPTHNDRQCFALVEDTRDSRIAHRSWHGQLVSDREALRGAIKERDDTIAGYRQELAEFRRAVTGYEETVAGLHGEVQRVETPIAPPALEISRETYDDEQPDEPPAPSWARYEPEEADPDLEPIPGPPATAQRSDDEDEDEDDPGTEGQKIDDDDEDVSTTARWAR